MVFHDLVDLYAREGFVVGGAVSPFLHPELNPNAGKDLTGMYIYRDGENRAVSGGGISLSEVYLIETLGAARPAKRVFGIGCSFGWSTFALALSNPGAKVVAIDIAHGTSAEGLELTNAIAKRNGLNVKGVLARSPEGVAPTLAAEFDAPLDLVFIDALHTDEAQLADYEAVRPHLAPDAVVLFHDVFLCSMTASFSAIARRAPEHDAYILSRTATGIGVLVPKAAPPALRQAVAAFRDPFAAIPV